MKAMIFAAGLGTRLRPFTERHPKALVPVGGVPMLGRVICKLRDAGISRIVVNVHHFADQIEEYLYANANFGTDIAVSDERAMLLDTGGGLLHAAPLLEDDKEPVILHNADILCDFPISAMLTDHVRTGALATLLVSGRQSSRHLLFDNRRLMRGWENVSTGQVKPGGLDTAGLRAMAFGGVHIVSGDIFPHLRGYRADGGAFSITDFYIDICCRCQIAGHTPTEPFMWHDVGRPGSLAEAESALARCR